MDQLTDAKLQELARLTNALIDIKEEEADIKHERIAVEEQIAALIPSDTSTQKTVTLLDGKKVTVTRGFTYKADIAAMKRMALGISDYFPPLPIKEEKKEVLDIVGYEWYKVNNSVAFDFLSKHVEIKPKKTSVTFRLPKAE